MLQLLESTGRNSIVMLGNGVWTIPAPDMPDGDYLTAIRMKGDVRIEISPWRHGEYQGVLKLAVFTGQAKVICVMDIPDIPEEFLTI